MTTAARAKQGPHTTYRITGSQDIQDRTYRTRAQGAPTIRPVRPDRHIRRWRPPAAQLMSYLAQLFPTLASLSPTAVPGSMAAIPNLPSAIPNLLLTIPNLLLAIPNLEKHTLQCSHLDHITSSAGPRNPHRLHFHTASNRWKRPPPDPAGQHTPAPVVS